MSLNSMNVGHTFESGRINDGCGSLFASGPDRLWRLSDDRLAKTYTRLWSRIPEGYRRGHSFSDFWKSYRPVFDDDSSHQQVGKSSGELAHVERFFGLVRQKLARYVRRTRAPPESERMLHLTTKLFVEWYNEDVT